jgi:hypothetical protein
MRLMGGDFSMDSNIRRCLVQNLVDDVNLKKQGKCADMLDGASHSLSLRRPRAFTFATSSPTFADWRAPPVATDGASSK